MKKMHNINLKLFLVICNVMKNHIQGNTMYIFDESTKTYKKFLNCTLLSNIV